jgi:hypothetical protein
MPESEEPLLKRQRTETEEAGEETQDEREAREETEDAAESVAAIAGTRRDWERYLQEQEMMVRVATCTATRGNTRGVGHSPPPPSLGHPASQNVAVMEEEADEEIESPQELEVMDRASVYTSTCEGGRQRTWRAKADSW